MNDAKLGTVQVLDGTTALAAAKLYPASAIATAAKALKLRFTPTSPNAVGFLVRWDAVAGACPTTPQANKTKLLAYAAVPPDVGLFLNRLTADFGRCFALPVASRVLGIDNTAASNRGGPTVTAVADVCQPPTSSTNGPGSKLADGSILSAVRVTGSGLPSVVHIPPVQSGQTWMDISNKAGDVAAAASRRCGATVPTTGAVYSNCPYLWKSRSTAVVPSAAAPVKRLPTATEGSCGSSPTATTTPNQTCAWGSTRAATDITATLVQNVPITVEVFYGGRTTPTCTYTKTLNAGLVDVTKAASTAWVALDSTSLVNARPAAGQTLQATTVTSDLLLRLRVPAPGIAGGHDALLRRVFVDLAEAEMPGL
jgi:hypothetical protein